MKYVILTSFFIVFSGCAKRTAPSDLDGMMRAFAYEIDHGDTVSSVRKVLGDGEILSPDRTRELASAVKRWQQDAPDLYMDGVEADDVFIIWKISGCDPVLQFRDGRLVNHSSKHYRKLLNDLEKRD